MVNTPRPLQHSRKIRWTTRAGFRIGLQAVQVLAVGGLGADLHPVAWRAIVSATVAAPLMPRLFVCSAPFTAT